MWLCLHHKVHMLRRRPFALPVRKHLIRIPFYMGLHAENRLILSKVPDQDFEPLRMEAGRRDTEERRPRARRAEGDNGGLDITYSVFGQNGCETLDRRRLEKSTHR